MKTFWFFGDSYTLGSGCGEREPYYKISTPGNIWRDIITNHYNVKDKTSSDGGICTPEILKRFIYNMSSIQPGDTVIIGDSVPTRIIGVSQHRTNLGTTIKPMVTFNNDTLTDGLHTDDIEIVSDNMNTYVNYAYDFVYLYSEIWERHYQTIIFNLKKELELRDIEVYFWSNKLWYVHEKFDTIWKATNGEIKDHHWSWKGHEQMADYMINRIDNKIYIEESEWNIKPSMKKNLDGTIRGYNLI